MFALFGVLDGLFEVRYFAATCVKLGLQGVESVGRGDLRVAARDLSRFDVTQARNLRLEFGAALCGELPTAGALLIQRAPTHGQAARGGLALFRLEFLIALGGACLPLQVIELLFEFVTNVVQTGHVFPGMTHAVLGLAATFLVPGNAGGLFEKRAQLFRSGFDHARDHALLNDRVAACANTGAEKGVGDVLAPAACTVQIIGRDAVAADGALD